jgi:hypothetical protein
MLAATLQPGSRRILAALEHGGKPAAKPERATAWSIDGWTASLGLLLLLILAAAWILHDDTDPPSRFKHSEGGRHRE